MGTRGQRQIERNLYIGEMEELITEIKHYMSQNDGARGGVLQKYKRSYHKRPEPSGKNVNKNISHWEISSRARINSCYKEKGLISSNLYLKVF